MPQSCPLPPYRGPALPSISAFSLVAILDHLQQECADASDAMLNVVETFQGDLGLELRRKLDAERKLQLVNSQQARRAHTLSKRALVARSKLDRYTVKSSSIDDEIDRLIEAASSASTLARLVSSKLHRVQRTMDSTIGIPSKFKTLNRVLSQYAEQEISERHKDILSPDTGNNHSVHPRHPNATDSLVAQEIDVECRKFEIEATSNGFLASNSHPTVQISQETCRPTMANAVADSSDRGDQILAKAWTASAPVIDNEELVVANTQHSTCITHVDIGDSDFTLSQQNTTIVESKQPADESCPGTVSSSDAANGGSSPPLNEITADNDAGDSSQRSNEMTANDNAGELSHTSNNLTANDDAGESSPSSNEIEANNDAGDSHSSNTIEQPMTPEEFEEFMATSIFKFRSLQKKRYKEAPFFAEPPPIIPHQNPLDLLYSSLLAKQNLVTSLNHRNRPPFSILRAKSDPTIMQSLQTSHFKKLRISGTHLAPENQCTPCQGPGSDDDMLDPDIICEDENQDNDRQDAITRPAPEILSSSHAVDYDDSSDEEPNRPSPRSPHRTHKPSHRTLRPKRSILKLRDQSKPRVPRFVPQSPCKSPSPQSSNVYSPAQPLVVCAHGASATLVRPSALDFQEPGPFPFSDTASIESYRSIKSLQKLQEYI